MSKHIKRLSLNSKLFWKNDVMYKVLCEEDEISMDETPDEYTTEKQLKNENYPTYLFRFFKTKKSLVFRMKDNSPLVTRKKCAKALQTVRSKFHGISQELRSSMRLKQSALKLETPLKCVTPNRKTKRILGRTPIRLYSPFAIETPPTIRTAWSSMDTPNLCDSKRNQFDMDKLEHLKKKSSNKPERSNAFRKLNLTNHF